MASSYPGALDSFVAKVDNVDDVMAVDVNELQEAIVAVQTELGTDPAGSLTDLKTRLAVAIGASGLLNFAASSELTIASGAITATQNWHTVDTEADAATDYLDSITAGTDGQVLFLRSASSARDVTIRSGVGNIVTGNAQAITLGLTSDLCILIYDTNLTAWIAAGITGAGLLNAANTWTGAQSFGAAIAYKYSSLNTHATLDATHYIVVADATTAAITVTLPAVAACQGRVYSVIKGDGSANAVTVDGAGSETINGATTYVISNQYTSLTILSNGTTGWFIV